MSDSPLATLNGDVGNRFKLVDLVPAVVLAATVGLLLFGGSPLGKDAYGEWKWSAGLLIAVAFVGALALRPFQVRLERCLEGYWKPTRLGKLLFELGVQRHLGRRRDLERLVNLGGERAERTVRERAEWAREQLRRYPAEARVMPTALNA